MKNRLLVTYAIIISIATMILASCKSNKYKYRT